MTETPTETVRVLVIAAHPDDADISSGGTIARWASEGREIHYVLCTSGNRGSNDPRMTTQLLGEIREREQRAAAEILGVASTTFLLQEDCELQETLAFRKEVAGLIRQFKPAILMTHDPWTRYRIHPDHRAVGFTALAAIVVAGNQMYREGMAPHTVGEVYLFQTDNPDYWVDVTATIDAKIEAIRQHKSQVSHSGEAMVARVREWAKQAGLEHNMAFAEGFKAVSPRH
ncbi:MAG: PIG-L family deacetylase [Chloroflexi bacterium]|nr:PIG-L family deacetylase [Chloroflexota bacterium]